MNTAALFIAIAFTAVWIVPIVIGSLLARYETHTYEKAVEHLERQLQIN